MGVYFANQFHLLVSLRYVPLAGEVGFLTQLFEQASRILHDATDGAHSIGHVFVAVDSWGTKSADVFVHTADGSAHATGARLWFPGEAIDIWQDGLSDATVLAHELAHYLYDVRDEYIGYDPSCVKSLAEQACLMEAYSYIDHTRWVRATNNESISSWALFLPQYVAGATLLVQGEPSDFCHPGNHDTGAATEQNEINEHQSCWSWMIDDERHGKIPYGLVLPASGPALPVPAAPLAVVLDELIPVQRFALVLDRSASMGGVKLEHMKIGATFWVDYVESGEELAILAYANAVDVVAPRTETPFDAGVEGWRLERRATVEALTAAGSTAIGDALEAGRKELIAGGLAADQVLLLLSDGRQNAGTLDPTAVLPDLIAANIRVYAIGLGEEQDAALLELLATTTGGEYLPIDATLTIEETKHAITEALIHVAGVSRNASSIAEFADVVASTAANAPSAPRALRSWTGEEPRFLRPRKLEHVASGTCEHPVVIAAGSTRCTLGVYWKSSPDSEFRVTIVDPDGTPVEVGAGVRRHRGTAYAFYVVDEPAGGTWTVRVSSADIEDARLRVFGFQVHHGLRLEAVPRRAIVRPGSEVAIPIRLKVPQTVPGLRIDASIRGPGKSQSKRIRLEADERASAREAAEAPVIAFETAANVAGAYLVSLRVSRPAGRFEYVPDGLRWVGSERPADKRRVTIEVPAIEMRVLTAAVADPSGRYETLPLHGANDRAPLVPEDQARAVERFKRSRPR